MLWLQLQLCSHTHPNTALYHQSLSVQLRTLITLQGVAIKKTPLCKMHCCCSGSELFCQIFQHCSLHILPSAVLVLLHLHQYFWYNGGLNITANTSTEHGCKIDAQLVKCWLQFRDVLRLQSQVTELPKHRPPNMIVKWIDVRAIWWIGVFVNKVWTVSCKPLLVRCCLLSLMIAVLHCQVFVQWLNLTDQHVGICSLQIASSTVYQEILKRFLCILN